jgi:hypothetical protein
MFTHTLLNNIINLENSVIEKDCEIINLKKEMKRLETLVCEVTEKNISQTEKIKNHVNSMKVPINAKKDAMQYITDKYNNKVEKLYAKNINQEHDVKEEKYKLYSFAGGVSFDATNESQLAIFTTCKKLCVRLIEKNKVGEKSTVTPLQLLQAFIHIIK